MKVRGHFDYRNEIYLGPKSDEEDNLPSGVFRGQAVPGLHVITPFKLEDREYVFTYYIALGLI